MPTLYDTEIYRRGVTRPSRLRRVNTDVFLTPSDRVQIDFEIASNGGFTAVTVALGTKDFPTILQMMSNANRRAAMKAMVNELQRQILEGPKTRTRKGVCPTKQL